MNNLQSLTLAELQQLLQNVNAEIAAREAKGNGFDAEYNVTSNGKAYYPATFKQYQYAESLAAKTNSIISCSSSQVIKRMEMEDMSAAIDLMKSGKRVHIY